MPCMGRAGFILLEQNEAGAPGLQFLRQGRAEAAEAANDDMTVEFVDLECSFA